MISLCERIIASFLVLKKKKRKKKFITFRQQNTLFKNMLSGVLGDPISKVISSISLVCIFCTHLCHFKSLLCQSDQSMEDNGTASSTLVTQDISFS